jgi:hypothetical protein
MKKQLPRPLRVCRFPTKRPPLGPFLRWRTPPHHARKAARPQLRLPTNHLLLLFRFGLLVFNICIRALSGGSVEAVGVEVEVEVTWKGEGRRDARQGGPGARREEGGGGDRGRGPLKPFGHLIFDKGFGLQRNTASRHHCSLLPFLPLFGFKSKGNQYLNFNNKPAVRCIRSN